MCKREREREKVREKEGGGGVREGWGNERGERERKGGE